MSVTDSPKDENFSAKETDKGVQLQWNLSHTIGGNVEVEKSINGINFSKVKSAIDIRGNWYEMTDSASGSGKRFYRLKLNYANSQQYSHILMVSLLNSSKPALMVIPNTVRNGLIKVQFQYPTNNVFDIRVTSTSGSIVSRSMFNHTGGTALMAIQLPPFLSNGIYFISATHGKEILKQTFVMISN
ncbi:MAG: T9SS type A sorting domain-containing protein [Sphingobacteriales bacterium]|nr:MAG: T9SS type A sorting domain-containing protein [Sphingobacteriales bacterium]